MIETKKLISIDISLGSYHNFIATIFSLAKKRESSYVCVANVHMLVEAYKDKKFQTVVNNADIVTPDGMPLAKGLDLIYGIKQKRVSGMDILPDLLKLSENSLSVYFYGGTEEMLERTKEYCIEKFPKLKIAGMYSPPFRELSEIEEEEVINKINATGTNFVFVALGCPKQERWMAEMEGKIQACMLGIGGALPVMIGMQKRAPIWMRNYSLEWLYRLYQEPKRLFKRYFITNNIFIYLLLSNYFKSKLGQLK